ncbi:indole-3-glycerol phosphate synthase TrpC [Fulvivirgaceae bacterium BMA10]|uniref:indole-3-glycerol-phosphate synthase n=1 Tax=Splendidivirga corallicola TaxID=3051826 RepID=A0ABT8KGH4_9BACT|nr:indole-3-glycerol phosphate synthase TrpC [Fulvivirgaceae bacterium BMA10]
MHILDKILLHKQKEVEERKGLFPTKLLEQSTYFTGKPVSLKKYILRPDKSGIIAEIKRKSPSKGNINPYVSIEKTSIGYMQAGASALSVLTDYEFFGGTNEDLKTARKFNFCPILRKDFIIDEYQIIEAKSIGADVILLIAAALTPERLKQLAEFAKSFDLEVLMEVHNEEELQSNIIESVDLIGVNNRNLKTFEVSIENSIRLAPLIPEQYIKVSESGISDPQKIVELSNHGFQGFLMGEHFMHHSRPEKACYDFIHELKVLKQGSTKPVETIK